jgi:hypothetical protein
MDEPGPLTIFDIESFGDIPLLEPGDYLPLPVDEDHPSECLVPNNLDDGEQWSTWERAALDNLPHLPLPQLPFDLPDVPLDDPVRVKEELIDEDDEVVFHKMLSREAVAQQYTSRTKRKKNTNENNTNEGKKKPRQRKPREAKEAKEHNPANNQETTANLAKKPRVNRLRKENSKPINRMPFFVPVQTSDTQAALKTWTDEVEDGFIAWMALQNCGPSTIKAYSGKIAQIKHLEHMPPPMPIHMLQWTNPSEVADFIAASKIPNSHRKFSCAIANFIRYLQCFHKKLNVT